MMFAPIDWSRIETAISTPRGWLELAMVAVCIGVAYFADHRVWRARLANNTHDRFTGGLARIVFPVTAMALLLVARALAGRSGSTFFLDIALPLFFALAGVRVIVYALRQLFVDAQWLRTSELSVSLVVWGIVVLHFVGALPAIAAELEAFKIPLGQSSISLMGIVKGVVAVVATLVVTLWISGLLETRVMKAHFDINLRVVLVKLIRAVLLAVGVLVALDTIGFDLTLLTVFGGALGVGIGLGLQKLASNYIAGFTILLDRSIRMDDRVTVADRTGRVIRLTSRYVVIRGIDGVEAIVPNETMVTSIVLNHSRTAPETRITMPIQVTYDSDVEVAMEVMKDAAAREPRVQAAPQVPQVHLLTFGDNGYQLQLLFWITDAEKGQDNLKSSVNRSILDGFKTRGIHLARPSREVRLVTPAAGTVLASEDSNLGIPPAG